MSGEAAKQHWTPENLQACADRSLKTRYISEITSFGMTLQISDTER